MHYGRSLLIFGLSLLLSTLAFAAGDEVSVGFGLFSVPGSDRSLLYLQQIFGAVGAVIPASEVSNPILGRIFLSFNTSLFTLGTLITTWIGVSSMLHSAAEGKMLGKDGGGMWSPVKVLIGLFILMPSSSGYSFIQVTVMWFILNSIGAANAIWGNLLDYYTYDAPYENISIDKNDAVLTQFVNMAFCQAALNSAALDAYAPRNPAMQATTIDIFTQGNTLIMGMAMPDQSILPVCGSVTVPDPTMGGKSMTLPPGLTADNITRIYQGALYGALENVAPLIQNAREAPDLGQWVKDNVKAIQNVKMNLEEAVQLQLHNYMVKTGPPSTTTAYKDGWIHAGSFYYVLAKQSGSLNNAFADPKPMTGFTDKIPNACSDIPKEIESTLFYLEQLYNPNCDAVINTQLTRFYSEQIIGRTNELGTLIRSALKDLKAEQAAAADRASGTLGVHINANGVNVNYDLPDATASNAGGLTIFPSLDFAASAFGKFLTTKTSDPLASVGSFGMGLLQFLDSLWTYSVIAAFLLLGIASAMQSCLPMTLALNAISQWIMTFQSALFILLFPAAVLLGIYTPLIPYLIFTTATIGWFVLVIEAMTAAPLVAISFLVPHASELGRATTAIAMLAGLFVRPALMIIGFAAATRLCQISIKMLNYSFFSAIAVQTGGTSLFGFIAIFVIYVGIVLSLINQSFTLIHHVPDQVIRWIGGQAEKTESKALGEIRKSVDKAGESGKTSNALANKGADFAMSGLKHKGGSKGASGGGKTS